MRLKIIHISDLHLTCNDPQINASHTFDPPATPALDYPPRAGWPQVWEMLERDLAHQEDPACPVIVCVTGDITHTAHPDEFARAKEFVRRLSKMKVFGRPRGLESIFVVPGNHDVIFDKPDPIGRSKRFIEFCNDAFGYDLDAQDPYSLVQLHDRVDELGVLVLCLHSAVWVQRDRPDQDRGQFDAIQLQRTRNLLDAVDSAKLKRSIRVALIHHHPVVIPPLAEKGYDAVLYSGELLNLLRRYGFHVVLHGHKHYPHNFTYDASSPFHEPGTASPDRMPRLTIVGGGSIGSRAIPDLGKKCNCYSWLTLDWASGSTDFRLLIETRRLRNRDDMNAHINPTDWQWDELGNEERAFPVGVESDASDSVAVSGSGIYVIGPVLRKGAANIAWADDVYRQLGTLDVPGLRLPVSEPDLETASPATFAQKVNLRIQESEAVIAVLPAGDLSAGVETVMAAALRKPQLIVAQAPERLPRLVTGLPNTWISTETDLVEKLGQFLNSVRKSTLASAT